MPITGQESALTSALTSAITAAIESKLGNAVMTPEYIDALSQGIANAIIPFLVSNVLVTPLAAGALTSPSGSVTGVTAPGTIS
jgi:hypothetical protein